MSSQSRNTPSWIPMNCVPVAVLLVFVTWTCFLPCGLSQICNASLDKIEQITPCETLCALSKKTVETDCKDFDLGPEDYSGAGKQACTQLCSGDPPTCNCTVIEENGKADVLKLKCNTYLPKPRCDINQCQKVCQSFWFNIGLKNERTVDYDCQELKDRGDGWQFWASCLHNCKYNEACDCKIGKNQINQKLQCPFKCSGFCDFMGEHWKHLQCNKIELPKRFQKNEAAASESCRSVCARKSTTNEAHCDCFDLGGGKDFLMPCGFYNRPEKATKLNDCVKLCEEKDAQNISDVFDCSEFLGKNSPNDARNAWECDLVLKNDVEIKKIDENNITKVEVPRLCSTDISNVPQIDCARMSGIQKLTLDMARTELCGILRGDSTCKSSRLNATMQLRCLYFCQSVEEMGCIPTDDTLQDYEFKCPLVTTRAHCEEVCRIARQYKPRLCDKLESTEYYYKRMCKAACAQNRDKKCECKRKNGDYEINCPYDLLPKDNGLNIPLIVICVAFSLIFLIYAGIGLCYLFAYKQSYYYPGKEDGAKGGANAGESEQEVQGENNGGSQNSLNDDEGKEDQQKYQTRKKND